MVRRQARENEEANEMPRPIIAGMVGAVIMALVTVAVLSDRTAAQSPFGDPNAEPSPFNPQMGALMSMLIQPRHTKLGLAGNAENWPLAGYMLKELRQGFAVVAKAVPRWKACRYPIWSMQPYPSR